MIDINLEHAFNCNPDLKKWVLKYCNETGSDYHDLTVSEILQAVWDELKERMER